MRKDKKLNMIKTSMKKEEDIWCQYCGDRTFFANIEEREIAWHKKDVKLGVGVCVPCSLAVDEIYTALPHSTSVINNNGKIVITISDDIFNAAGLKIGDKMKMLTEIIGNKEFRITLEHLNSAIELLTKEHDLKELAELTNKAKASIKQASESIEEEINDAKSFLRMRASDDDNDNHVATVIKEGDDLIIKISDDILNDAGLKIGDKVNIYAERNGFLVLPYKEEV